MGITQPRWLATIVVHTDDSKTGAKYCRGCNATDRALEEAAESVRPGFSEGENWLTIALWKAKYARLQTIDCDPPNNLTAHYSGRTSSCGIFCRLWSKVIVPQTRGSYCTFHSYSRFWPVRSALTPSYPCINLHLRASKQASCPARVSRGKVYTNHAVDSNAVCPVMLVPSRMTCLNGSPLTVESLRGLLIVHREEHCPPASESITVF